MNIFEKTLKDEQELLKELGQSEYVHFNAYTRVLLTSFLSIHGLTEKYKAYTTEFERRANEH